ncbi:MAG: cyclic pyranopterin monophosphate synthase MoaC [Caldiserica bacterium]|nr:cyclic pyranopterin monophosphate synthase MoaC [Caldisericota bacterium]
MKYSMVDVSGKPASLRWAYAQGKILLSRGTVEKIRKNELRKGDVLSLSESSGIVAAKWVPYLIPLAHNVRIDKVNIKFSIEEDGIVATSEVRGKDRTGMELESLFAVSVALLNIYDFCKAEDEKAEITGIKLLEKGKQEVEKSLDNTL